MSSTKKTAWPRAGFAAVATLSAVYAVPCEAVAQAAVASEGDQVSEVVVTARRRDERLQDVPAAISVVSGSQLDRAAITKLTDVAKLVPQLLIERSFTGTGANVYLRGVGSAAQANSYEQSVSLNVDNVQVSRGTAILFDYLDVSGVEVLKGPQSLYYGKNASAGILSIRSRDPSQDYEAELRTGYELEADRYYLQGVVNIPVNDALALRFAARGARQEGYLRNEAKAFVDTRGLLIPGPKHSRSLRDKELAGRFTAVFKPNDSFDAKLKLFGARVEGDYLPRQLWRCPLGTPQPIFGVPRSAEDCKLNRTIEVHQTPPAFLAGWPETAGGPFQDSRTQLHSLEMNYRHGDATLTSVTAYYRGHIKDVQVREGQNVAPEDTDYTSRSQELRFSAPLTPAIRTVFAAYYQETSHLYDLSTRLAALPPDPLTGTYESIHTIAHYDGKAYSLMGEVIWDVTPQVELDVGVRWTRETKTLNTIQPYVAPGLRGTFGHKASVSGAFSDENISPQATLTYRPQSWATYYVGYRTGYKSGGFNTTGFISPIGTANDFKFESEDAEGFDVGAKLLLADGRLSVNLAAYRTVYKDLQVQVFDASTTSFFSRNAGRLTNRGVEVDAVWDLADYVEGVSVRGAAAYNRSRYGDYIGPCYTGQRPSQGCTFNPNRAGVFTSQDYGGRTPPRAPRWAGSFGVDYKRDIGSGLVLGASADTRFTSKYNTLESLAPEAVQSGYAMFDANFRVTHEDNGWEIAFIGRNLADKNVVITAGDFPFTGSGTGTPNGLRSDLSAVTTGRSLEVQFSYKF